MLHQLIGCTWNIDIPTGPRYPIRMRCIVTAGPTYEKLDEVRRLTNFSTGRLGTELAAHLAGKGHEVELLLGELAVWQNKSEALRVTRFSTTHDLQARLAGHAGSGVNAVFHAAAVSDFSFGTVFEKGGDGSLTPVREGKVSTRSGQLLVELSPTPKLIGRFREWYPDAFIVGWKFEVDGDRDSVLSRAVTQIRENRTDACVANGPAYGDGFALVSKAGEPVHVADREALFSRLESAMRVTG